MSDDRHTMLLRAELGCMLATRWLYGDSWESASRFAGVDAGTGRQHARNYITRLRREFDEFPALLELAERISKGVP